MFLQLQILLADGSWSVVTPTTSVPAGSALGQIPETAWQNASMRREHVLPARQEGCPWAAWGWQRRASVQQGGPAQGQACGTSSCSSTAVTHPDSPHRAGCSAVSLHPSARTGSYPWGAQPKVLCLTTDHHITTIILQKLKSKYSVFPPTWWQESTHLLRAIGSMILPCRHETRLNSMQPFMSNRWKKSDSHLIWEHSSQL